jgi:hypothetical protein
MAAMLVPLPETSSSQPATQAPPDSNTLVPSHYPAWRYPMTNIGDQPFGGLVLANRLTSRRKSGDYRKGAAILRPRWGMLSARQPRKGAKENPENRGKGIEKPWPTTFCTR